MKIAQFIARIIFGIAFLLILYRFALNGRYQVISNSQYMIDKWTNKAIEPKNWKEFMEQVSKETSSGENQQTEQTKDNYEEQ